MKRVLFALALAMPIAGQADPLAGAVDAGTSVAHSFLARDVFANPAALGFANALDGSDFSMAALFGFDRANHTDGALGLTAGPVGLGYERFSTSSGPWSRFRLAGGVPISPWLFAGARWSWNHLPNERYSSFDLGLQFRPSRYVSFGAVANGLNEPRVAGSDTSAQYIFGVALRPPGTLERWLEGSFDADTSGHSFGDHWDWMSTLRVGPWNGWRVSAGYHSQLRWQLGLRIDFGSTSTFATAQPDAGNGRRWLAGVTTSTRPLERSANPENAKVTLGGPMAEKGVEGSLLRSGTPSFGELLMALRRAERREGLQELRLVIDSFPLGYAAAFEMQDALLRLRAKGKRVVAFLGHAGPREYIIASAADEIVFDPAGELRLLGFRAQRYFIRGTLDKLGVEPEFLAAGKFKSAPEMFTQKGSSPASRESSEAIVDGIEQLYVERLGRARKIDAAAWKTITERGLLGPDDAKELKLVDSISGRGKWEAKHSGGSEGTLRKPHRERLAMPRRIAAIPIEGSILRDAIPGAEFVGGAVASPEQFEKEVDAALADPLVDAIVIRVNSGGGEILASNELAELVEKAAEKKPTIISMGDAAASGGYFLAAPAPTIIASPATITGSIGVFLGSFSLEELYRKIDLRKETTSRSPLAELDTEHRRWTSKERAVFQRRLDDYYRMFKAYVGKHRKLDDAAVESVAQGRVWLGSAAKERKLADRLGGLEDALALAAEQAGGTLDDYDVRFFVKQRGLIDVSDFTPRVEALLPKSLQRVWMEAKMLEQPYLFLEPLTVQ